jgi:hypothetical protein
MAQKIEVLLLDDLDGSEANQTVRFALDGVAYEIDLSDVNAETLRSSLAAFVEHGRRSRGGDRRDSLRAGRRDAPDAVRGGRSTRTHQAQLLAIREWARENGHAVSDRGRIPHAVLAAYESAT